METGAKMRPGPVQSAVETKLRSNAARVCQDCRKEAANTAAPKPHKSHNATNNGLTKGELYLSR
jgi:hypothetical protein